VKFLLDTHIALWAVVDSQRLSKKVQGWISDPDNDIAISIVSLWEIAIKRSVRPERRDTPQLSSKAARLAFVAADFELLAITIDQVELVEGLPLHHGDPFDRLMVAQAQIEGFKLLTHDKALAAYGDFVIVV
jgi:PIN domain nuclease of toxin-antitoxin system